MLHVLPSKYGTSPYGTRSHSGASPPGITTALMKVADRHHRAALRRRRGQWFSLRLRILIFLLVFNAVHKRLRGDARGRRAVRLNRRSA